jgi:hypothetical protein
MRGSRAFVSLLVCGLACLPLQAQTDEAAPAEAKPRFRLGGEMKIHGRHTDSLEVVSEFPFPPPFIPPGQAVVFLRTPEPGF